MIKEFKAFIMRGNVMDLAVGVIIGAAFSAIVASLTEDLIMPVIGLFLGGADFSNYFIGLSSAVTATTLDAAREQGAVFAYGKFITAVINFVLIAAGVFFFIVKPLNILQERQKSGAEPPPPTPEDIELLREIRDLLRSR